MSASNINTDVVAVDNYDSDATLGEGNTQSTVQSKQDNRKKTPRVYTSDHEEEVRYHSHYLPGLLYV